MKNNRGVTLVELLVVISVIAVLAVALGFSYQGWQGRFKVESAVKQLHTDLMDARGRAMQRNSTYLAGFPTATTYRIANDLNGNGIIDAAEVLPTFPKTVSYILNAYSYDGAVMTTKAITTVVINFDTRGLISSPVLLLDPNNPVIMGVLSFTSTSSPDYDCIIVAPTKIRMGQMAGGVCNAK
jgi:prepilin-type N-terminal cleavage/methylation domain-containing protein